MKIGLYFGSFNPIHQGHLIIANHVIEHCNVDKIWFVLSPQNPLKSSKTLLNEYHRLHLVELAIRDNPKFSTCDIEFRLTKPSYTINTLVHLKELHPLHQFKIIMGSDSFVNLSKWKNYEVLIRDYSFIVYQRAGFLIDNVHNAKIEIAQAPLLEISSTYIRNQIASKKSIRYLCPDNVCQYIVDNGYYLSAKK